MAGAGGNQISIRGYCLEENGEILPFLLYQWYASHLSYGYGRLLFQYKKTLQYCRNTQWNLGYCLDHWDIYKSSKNNLLKDLLLYEVFTTILVRHGIKPYQLSVRKYSMHRLLEKLPGKILACWYMKKRLVQKQWRCFLVFAIFGLISDFVNNHSFLGLLIVCSLYCIGMFAPAYYRINNSLQYMLIFYMGFLFRKYNLGNKIFYEIPSVVYIGDFTLFESI